MERGVRFDPDLQPGNTDEHSQYFGDLERFARADIDGVPRSSGFRQQHHPGNAIANINEIPRGFQRSNLHDCRRFAFGNEGKLSGKILRVCLKIGVCRIDVRNPLGRVKLAMKKKRVNDLT